MPCRTGVHAMHKLPAPPRHAHLQRAYVQLLLLQQLRAR